MYLYAVIKLEYGQTNRVNVATGKNCCMHKCSLMLMISVDLSEIKEIRQGWQTDTFQAAQRKSGPEKLEENRCFSLVLGAKHETLDLVAESPEQREQWLKVLTSLTKRQKYSALRRQHFKYPLHLE